MRLRTSPTPSTWPCTMWPPRRLSAVTARSRLTVSPGRTPYRLVLSSVSCITSAVHVSPSTVVTVRQQPLTAMESPRPASSSTVVARMLTRIASPWSSTAATVPSSSTIPVNMSGSFWCEREAHVGRVALQHRDVGDAGTERIRDGGDSEVGDGRAAGAEQHRRDVRDDLVDEAVAEERRGEGRPALQEDVLAAEVVQLGERGLRVAGAQVHRLRVGVEHPPLGVQ